MGTCQSRNESSVTLLPATTRSSSSNSSRRQVHSEDTLTLVGIVSQRERSEALERIRKAGWRELSHMSDKFRNDETIVGMAVEMAIMTHAATPPLALASARLKADRAFVLRAVRVDPQNVQYAAPQLKQDRTFVVEAIRWDWRVLLSLPEIWRNTPTTALCAVQQSGRALRYVAEDLRNDRSIVAAAVEQNWMAFPYASRALQADSTIARRAFFQNGNVFDALDEMAQTDVELLALSIRYSHNLEFRWREALQTHKSSLITCVTALLQQEGIGGVSVRTLGARRDEHSDWKGTTFVNFAKRIWIYALYYKLWLLHQKVGRLGPVFDAILEYSNLRYDAQLAQQLIRLAPLLATLHLRGIVNWRNLPDAFPVVQGFRG